MPDYIPNQQVTPLYYDNIPMPLYEIIKTLIWLHYDTAMPSLLSL